MTVWDGGQLPAFASDLVRLGLVSGLSNEEYHGAPGVSKSKLDKLARSPAHYLAYLDEPRRETPALRFGRLIHMAVLEPEALMLSSVPPDAPPRPTSRQRTAKKPSQDSLDAIKWWDEFDEANAGCVIVSADESEQIRRIQDSIYRHPEARGLLEAPGQSEVSAWFYDQDRDEATGELCKCRPDRLMDMGDILDLKSCEDASPAGFGRSAAKYRYYVQGALYLDGMEATTKARGGSFGFIAFEKEPPFAVAVYVLRPQDVELGREEYRRNLAILAQCKINRHWPGYSEQAQFLSLPGWARRLNA